MNSLIGVVLFCFIAFALVSFTLIGVSAAGNGNTTAVVVASATVTRLAATTSTTTSTTETTSTTIPETTTSTTSTTTTIPETTTTTLPTCDISTNPISFAFGNMIPGDASTSDQPVTITNNGASQTTNLTVRGSQWSSGTDTFNVSQTHYDETASNDPYSSMTALTGSDVPLVNNILDGGNFTSVYFKLAILAGQPSGSYSQTITFTSTC